MKKRSVVLAFVAGVLAFGASGAVRAHECTYDGEQLDSGNQVECHDSPVAPNWRDGNYVPVFDLDDREDEDQRRDAQRWREECQYYDTEGRYHNRQQCAWAYGGTSFFENPNGGQGPNEAHAGFAANHCFLFEFAHQCEDHDVRHGEGVHDKHGGAIYVDACLVENDESKYCDDGVEDTQAGLTIMDHNPCGGIVPIVACIDEYHVLRPFDAAYTEEQMQDSAEYIPRIIEDPVMYLCGRPGYPTYGFVPFCEDRATDEGAAGKSVLERRALVMAAASGAYGPEVAARTREALVSGARALGLRQDGATPASSAASGAFALALLAMLVFMRARRLVRA